MASVSFGRRTRGQERGRQHQSQYCLRVTDCPFPDLPERFILAGHSFGGAVALEYADRWPERLERLILVATPIEFRLPRSVGLLTRIPTPIYRLFWRYRPRWNAQPHVLKRMLLDTGTFMVESQALYRKMGFGYIEPYYEIMGPLRDGLVFMEKEL